MKTLGKGALLVFEILESPSLSGSAGLETPAYELKFLLTETQAKEVQVRMGEHLRPDPFADPTLGYAYQTTSLYCDTAQLEVFHRLGGFKRRKHRLRRYGEDPWIFLERKTKWGNRVHKKRSKVPDADLSFLVQASPEATWTGHWFHRHLQRRQLFPVCRIAYERVALMGRLPTGPVRLTFDRHIRGVLTKEWDLRPFDGGTTFLCGKVICEFKYQTVLPAIFKEVIEAMCLSPSPVSKYRAFLRELGYAEVRSPVDA